MPGLDAARAPAPRCRGSAPGRRQRRAGRLIRTAPAIFLAIGRRFDYMRGNIRPMGADVHRPPLDDIPAVGDPFPPIQKEKHDVDHRRTQAGTRQGIRDRQGRHRLAGSPGGDPFRAHPQPDRALQGPQEGQPFPSWSARSGFAAPQPARLPEAQGRGSLSDPDREARPAPLERWPAADTRCRPHPRAGPRPAKGSGIEPRFAEPPRTGSWGRIAGRLETARAPRCLARGSSSRSREAPAPPSGTAPPRFRIEGQDMFNHHKVEIEWGGRPLILETGKIARQADGAVLATYGETVVLATVVSMKEPKPGLDFFPLTVNYQEKTFAAGKIPGGYFKREGRPTEKETLVSRLIDRPIRPLFADGYKNDTQIVVTVVQHDLQNDPAIVATAATSAALSLSGVPSMGPIGGARVGYINCDSVLNPHIDEMQESKLDLVVAGTSEAVLMVESE